MVKSILLPLSLSFAAAACSSGGGDEGPGGGGGAPPQGDTVTPGAFLPDDGLIVIELESGSAAGSWAEETSLTGFTGSSYLTWTGPNHYSDAGNDTFGFDFWIEDAGTYAFRIHNRHDHADSTLANDAWVRMDDGDWVKTFSWQRGQWTWATNHEFSHTNKPEASYVLSRGNHRIEFSGRSADFSMDRFHLYDSGVVDPMSTNHPESARAGSSMLAGAGAGPGDTGSSDVGPGSVAWVTADEGLTTLLQLDAEAMGATPDDAQGEFAWTVPGAEFADGTTERSRAPILVVPGGVATPVRLELNGAVDPLWGVIQVEGVPGQLVGELAAGRTVELHFDSEVAPEVALVSDGGIEFELLAVPTANGARVTFSPPAGGLWRYRALAAQGGETLEGAFRVVDAE